MSDELVRMVDKAELFNAFKAGYEPDAVYPHPMGGYQLIYIFPPSVFGLSVVRMRFQSDPEIALFEYKEGLEPWRLGADGDLRSQWEELHEPDKIQTPQDLYSLVDHCRSGFQDVS